MTRIRGPPVSLARRRTSAWSVVIDDGSGRFDVPSPLAASPPLIRDRLRQGGRSRSAAGGGIFRRIGLVRDGTAARAPGCDRRADQTPIRFQPTATRSASKRPSGWIGADRSLPTVPSIGMEFDPALADRPPPDQDRPGDPGRRRTVRAPAPRDSPGSPAESEREADVPVSRMPTHTATSDAKILGPGGRAERSCSAGRLRRRASGGGRSGSDRAGEASGTRRDRGRLESPPPSESSKR